MDNSNDKYEGRGNFYAELDIYFLHWVLNMGFNSIQFNTRSIFPKYYFWARRYDRPDVYSFGVSWDIGYCK